jgi:uncharacterized membrane protein HdeD (DUF308 family)
MLAKAISRYWWLALVRGVVAIMFGLIAFSRPGATLAALLLFFGGFALIDGVLTVCLAIAARKSDEDWWVVLLEGVVAVLFGVLVFMRPGMTSLALLYLIGAWAVVTGALRVVMAIYLRREIHGEGWLAAGGILSILFGVLMFASPATGALALLFVIGAWALVQGASMLAVAFKLKHLHEGPEVPTLGHPAT